MDKRIEAMRIVGRASLDGKLTPQNVADAEFLDDCVQVLTGCRFGEPGCDHQDCK